MSKELFLWPHAAPMRARHFLTGHPGHAALEARLRRLYPAAEPVLFSSARAGLRATLAALGLGRPDLVWCPPYSSHCVFDAIARLATPCTLPDCAPTAALIYHQWGFVHRHDFPASVTVIEDAVDTLLRPGASPFAAGGRYALWSLPKVIASHWGGVVFCRDAEDAEALRRQRDASPVQRHLQALLRLAGDRHLRAGQYWHGVESTGGPLPGFALNHIDQQLQQLPAIFSQVQDQLARCRSLSLLAYERDDRLPCNLPVPAELDKVELSGIRLTAGLRAFNLALTAPRCDWQRVLPLPIHLETIGTNLADILASSNH